MKMEEFAVCKAGGQTYFGNEMEYIAARLVNGDSVLFNGETETVDFTWFYDGLIINLVSGKKINPSFGDVFDVLPPILD